MTHINEEMARMLSNIERVIVGKHDVIELILIALVCEGHVLIEDVPGVGKTSLVAALAKSVQGEFRRIQFTPDILPSDITGFSIYNQKTGAFEYKAGVVFSQFIIADEHNRTSPKTQASLLEVMEEGQVTVDGITYPLPTPFMVLATQNPIDYLGTFPLPEAQLDRFLMKLSIGYPKDADEQKMLQKFKEGNPLTSLEAVADGKKIVEMQKQVRMIYVEESIQALIVDIVQQTRQYPDVLLGASPRGSLGLFRAAQGLAFYMGRSYVLPDDVLKMAPYVLPHRILLKHEAKLRNMTSERVVQNILDKIKLPKVDYYEKK